MKKMLGFLGSLNMLAAISATVVSCGVSLNDFEIASLKSIKDLEVVVDYQQGQTTVNDVEKAVSTALKSIALGAEFLDDYTIENTLWKNEEGETDLVLKPGFARVEATSKSRFFTDGFKVWVLIDIVKKIKEEYPDLLHEGTAEQAAETKILVLNAIKKIVPDAELGITHDFYFLYDDLTKGWKLTFNQNQDEAKYYISYEFKILESPTIEN